MGCITFGAPRVIIQRLRETFHLDTFVETGTHLGDTSAWASTVFGQVYTIEASEGFYHEARQRHADRTNIEFLLGDSRTRLAETVGKLTAPALFWLDAHWMGSNPLEGAAEIYGLGSECPVLQEIAIINSSPLGHFIFIDDARFFLAPPQRPHQAADWPDIAATLAAINTPTARYTVVYDDVIAAVPADCRTQVQSIYQDIVTAGPPRDPAKNTVWQKILRRLGAR